MTQYAPHIARHHRIGKLRVRQTARLAWLIWVTDKHDKRYQKLKRYKFI